MNSDKSVEWVAADYCFPTTYSCRSTMSSIGSSSLVPTPGPATIRLALIRTSVELLGVQWTRDEFFPFIRSTAIFIRPPYRVGVSIHRQRGYKAMQDKAMAEVYMSESIIYREFAHSSDPMTIHLKAPTKYINTLQMLLMAIGYWGQASSLVQCTGICCAVPILNECAIPLRLLDTKTRISHLVTGFITELRDETVTWQEITGEQSEQSLNILRTELYLWPMQVVQQHKDTRLLLRCTL